MRFLWMKARPLFTFLTLMAFPFLPVVPWVLAAGPDPAPLTPTGSTPEPVSLKPPIPTGAADPGDVRGPSPPLDPAAVRKMAKRWEVKPIDASGWRLLMTDRFAVRGDIRTDDLRAAGAFAERFLDSVHERVKGDLADVRLSIRVFAQEEEFLQWASCRQVESSEWLYDRPGGEIAILFGGSTDVSAFCGNLMRGVVLEYLDRALDYEGPQRIAHGVAEWFADYDVAKGRVAPRRHRGDVGELLRIREPERLDDAWKMWTESPE